ncbi:MULTISPECIES: hypothetical protein [Pseudomonas syringae group]|uniref:hypothetical protein n=1 Tax=Pseudomonas syringae group TaxID=136849 RepID=UPI0005B6F466|nr:hypothetical protein [Pseudomonas viridiflava]KIQ37341.1 hypothetical protein RT94_02650 [Pseudomonas viridiflava]MBD8567668.1 hypothetical protein [Pseudomonas syringae]MBD8806982.1 hypothetical protein [Pseudomonas syringae]
MSEMDKLAEALRLKKTQDEQASASSRELVEEWQRSLQKLFAQLEEWLSPLVSAGVASVKASLTKKKDESPGLGVFLTYDAPVLILEINHKTVLIEPIGLFVSGTDGRVVIVGDDKRFLLSRTLKPTESWDISTYLSPFDTTPSVQRSLSEDSLAQAFANFL